MSAMLIESVRVQPSPVELEHPEYDGEPVQFLRLPTRPEQAPGRPRWHHVPRAPQGRGPVARQSHPAAPGGRPVQLVPPQVRTRTQPVTDSSWQLTRRGLALAMTVFLGSVAAATITLVGAFFSVPNEPAQPAPVVIAQG